MFALLLSTVLVADPPVPKEALPPPKEAKADNYLPDKHATGRFIIGVTGCTRAYGTFKDGHLVKVDFEEIKEAADKYDPAPAACDDSTCGAANPTAVVTTERGRFRIRERVRVFGRRRGGCSSGS